MSMQRDASECQRTSGRSSGDKEVWVPAEHSNPITKIEGNKYYIHIAGKRLKCHDDIIENVLQQAQGLEVKTVTGCDVILLFCTIASRAGTNIESALKELNRLSDSKPAIFVALHHTFDPEKTVPDSSKCVNRSNTLTVDCLFHEDKGLLKSLRNNEALERIQQCLPTQQACWFSFWRVSCSSKPETKTHEEISTANLPSEPEAKLLKEIEDLLKNNDQTNQSGASELTVVLLNMSESGKSEAGNMIFWREEKSQAGVSTATQKTTVESETVPWEQVSVIDTSDWFTSGLSPEEIKQIIHLCICICSGRPYAFLLVIPVTLTTKEREMVRNIEMSFEESCCWKKVMILFTVTDEQENGSIEKLIKQQNLQTLVQKCENRFHLFNFNQIGNSAVVSKLINQMLAEKSEMNDVLSHSAAAVTESYRPESRHTVLISKCPRKEKIVKVLSNLIKVLLENPETTIKEPFEVIEKEELEECTNNP